MKEFSVEIDRKFEFGGEVFKWRQPYWEDYAKLLDKDIEEARLALEKAQNGDPATELSDDTVHAAIAGLIKRVEQFLDPENDAVKRWRSLAGRKTDAIAAWQFRELHQWLVEVTSGRPPTELLSGNGQSSTEATSTEGSS